MNSPQMMDSREVISCIQAEIVQAAPSEANAYLLGALHDGSFNRLHRTIRIVQADIRWLELLQVLIRKLGKKSWLYREGKRNVWALESTCRPSRFPLLTSAEQAAYARGYFDAEGGVPRLPNARLYLQLAQKDRRDIQDLYDILKLMGIRCGVMHNPSSQVDSQYWRFYILAPSHLDFMIRIGSWHPRKRLLFEARKAHLEMNGKGSISIGSNEVSFWISGSK